MMALPLDVILSRGSGIINRGLMELEFGRVMLILGQLDVTIGVTRALLPFVIVPLRAVMRGIDGRLPAGAGRQALLVRPEKITLRRPGAAAVPGTNALAGRVSEAIYLGSGVKYEVTLADGTRGVARMGLAEAPFALGEAVEVTWLKQDARLLPDDGSSITAQSGEEE